MLSRDADNCFWIGRYVERAEALARILDVMYHASLETGDTRSGWAQLGLADPDGPRGWEDDDRAAIHRHVFDTQNPDAIVPLWGRARDNARTIREQLSSEMWESINITWLELQDWDAERVMRASPDQFLAKVRDGSHLFQGILDRTMLAGEARDWLDTGRFLERACQTVRHLLVCASDLGSDGTFPRRGIPSGQEGASELRRWWSALRSVSGLEMHRKVNPAGVDAANVVEFLLLDNRFPASVRHGVSRTEACLYRISGRPVGSPGCDSERLCGRLGADLTFTDSETIIGLPLSSFLNEVSGRLDAIGDAVAREYLVY